MNHIYSIEDFYENNFLPKMMSFPHQYVSRIIASKNRKAGKGALFKDQIRRSPNVSNNVGYCCNLKTLYGSIIMWMWVYSLKIMHRLRVGLEADT